MITENKIDNTYIITNPSSQFFHGNQIDLQNLPKVSFCIPTKNNENTIEKCLKSIVNQNYPHIEIIIIDGYSHDKTLDIVKKYTAKIIYDAGTYGSACQTGVEHSDGEIIALFDSDLIIPHNDWLKNAIQYFNYDNLVSSVWPLCIAPPNSPKVEYLYQTKLHWILIHDRIQNNRSVFGGGNSLFLKKCLIEIGGIDRSIHWGADFDWAIKLKNRGYKVIFIEDPLYHDTMRTLKQFYKKQFAGAETFTKSGFKMMGLTKKEVFYENFILGIKSTFRGLFIEQDTAWLYYPVFLFIRILAYSFIFLRTQFGISKGH
jgi:glycosyltransferase involved in cell wall biosynthesis